MLLNKHFTYISEYSELQLNVSVDGKVVLLVLSPGSSFSSPEFWVPRSILLKTCKAKYQCLLISSWKGLSEEKKKKSPGEQPESLTKVWIGAIYSEGTFQCYLLESWGEWPIVQFYFLLEWGAMTSSHSHHISLWTLYLQTKSIDALGFPGLGSMHALDYI